jgi:uncharacterized protein (DUF433 family)
MHRQNLQPETSEIMKQWEKLDVIEQVPGKVSGVWVFVGTRVPVSALFENLRDGATIDEFLSWFPGVERQQVEAVLNYELESLAAVP